jgi:DNA/RNA-binding protein KIN17
MLVVGEDPRRAINDFSNQFLKDFMQLLRTAHGEKKVNINHFYQEYIANKEHVHMNATKWPSLTEFAKYLGKEGRCRVEDTEKGLFISWIDDSPEALRRQDAIRKKERQDRGDEEREQRLIREQVERATLLAEAKSEEDEETKVDTTPLSMPRGEGEKIKLDFSMKPAVGSAKTRSPSNDAEVEVTELGLKTDLAADSTSPEVLEAVSPSVEIAKPAAKFSLGSSANKPKNVFAAASKKNVLGATKRSIPKETETKPMSQAERIMKEEIERKRRREVNGMDGLGGKRHKVQ